MRVIQVNKYHFLKGGAERYYLDLSEALERRGHIVRHLAMRHASNVDSAPEDRFVEEVDYRAGLSIGAKLRHASRVVWNLEAERLARQLARGGGATVAHLHNIYHQLSPSVIAAFSAEGVPVVQTLHDYKLVCPAYLLMTEGRVCERCRGARYWNAMRHRCLLDSSAASLVASLEAWVHEVIGTYRKVDRFLCPSRFMLDKVASFGVERERLLHLPYFVVRSRYRPAPIPEPRGGPRTCVYVGRLSREKGIATLIDAMSRLPDGRLRLWVLGDGPLRRPLEERAARLAGDRVRFLGFQSGDSLHETIRQASFAIVPSEWYENLPYAVLEPFALGRAVLGTRIGGIPELVEDGVTGRLAEAGSAESIAEALLWMTGPDADLGRMGENARLRVEREHDEAAHLERLLGIYARLAAPEPAEREGTRKGTLG